jgi:hypothetical protein
MLRRTSKSRDSEAICTSLQEVRTTFIQSKGADFDTNSPLLFTKLDASYYYVGREGGGVVGRDTHHRFYGLGFEPR